MCFVVIWNFGGIQNAYYYFNQTHSIVVIIAVLVLYFIPYALIVGELGSTFKDSEGGLSGWINNVIGPKSAYFVGWISWVVLLPYLSQRPTNLIVSFNWIINQNGEISYLDPVAFQIIAIIIFLVILAFSFRGFGIVNVISSIGGIATIVFALIYIIFMFFAPSLNVDPVNVKSYSIDWSVQSFIPSDLSFFGVLSIMIFGFSGVEQASPYIPRMKNPGKEFPKGIVSMALAISVINILGILTMCVMFGPNGEEIGGDFITNGQYLAFQKLGQYFGLGNIFMIVYAILRFVSDVALTMIIIDAPIRMLVGTSDKRFFPNYTLKTNKYGSYYVWLIIEGMIVVILLLLPILSIGNVDGLIKWMLEVNSVCSPLINVCVFLAYIFYKYGFKKITVPKDSYIFTKNKKLGIAVGAWCALVTLSAIFSQICDGNAFNMLTKAFIPIFLLLLGFIVPLSAKILNR